MEDFQTGPVDHFFVQFIVHNFFSFVDVDVDVFAIGICNSLVLLTLFPFLFSLFRSVLVVLLVLLYYLPPYTDINFTNIKMLRILSASVTVAFLASTANAATCDSITCPGSDAVRPQQVSAQHALFNLNGCRNRSKKKTNFFFFFLLHLFYNYYRKWQVLLP